MNAEGFVAAMVIVPAPGVIVTLEPAVRLASVYPEPLPIRSWPLVGVEDRFVPPFAIGRTPLMSPTGTVATVETAPNPPDP